MAVPVVWVASLFSGLSSKPDSCNPMTAWTTAAGSQKGSQRRQAVSGVAPHSSQLAVLSSCIKAGRDDDEWRSQSPHGPNSPQIPCMLRQIYAVCQTAASQPAAPHQLKTAHQAGPVLPARLLARTRELDASRCRLAGTGPATWFARYAPKRPRRLDPPCSSKPPYPYTGAGVQVILLGQEGEPET